MQAVRLARKSTILINSTYETIKIIYLTSLPADCNFAADKLIHKNNENGNEQKNGLCTAYGNSYNSGFGRSDCRLTHKKCGIERLGTGSDADKSV
jgi:hypothetical protein